MVGGDGYGAGVEGREEGPGEGEFCHCGGGLGEDGRLIGVFVTVLICGIVRCESGEEAEMVV